MLWKIIRAMLGKEPIALKVKMVVEITVIDMLFILTLGALLWVIFS